MINIQQTEIYQSKLKVAGDPQQSGVDVYSIYDSLADLPTVAEFGAGVAQVGGMQLVSDGFQWKGANTRTEVVRVATFGDSLANLAYTDTDIDTLTAAFPASSATTLSHQLYKSNLPTYYPLAEYVANGGVSGDTTAQMLARDTATAGATRKSIGDVIDLYPDVVILHGGSINNLLGKAVGTIAAAVETCYTGHIAVIERFLSAGIPIIDAGLFGYSGSDSIEGLVRAAIIDLNSRFAAYAATTCGRVVFVDTLNLLHDSTGRYFELISYDGTHLNANGASLLSEREALALKMLFGEPSGTKFKGANLLGNSLFTATTTDAKGTYPTGMVFTLNAGTVTDSEIVSIDGKNWATFVLTPSGTSSNNFKFPFDPTAMSIVANDIFGFELEFFIESVNGNPIDFTGLYHRLDIYKSGAGRVIFENSFVDKATDAPKYQAKISKKIQITEPSANLTTSSICQLTLTTADTTPLRIGICHPSLVRI